MENAGSDRRSSIPVADGKGIRIAVQACTASGQGYCDSFAGCRPAHAAAGLLCAGGMMLLVPSGLLLLILPLLKGDV